MEKWLAVEPWAPEDSPTEVLPLKLAPGTGTGFAGVHKAGTKYEARKWVKGKGTRVVYKHDDPRICAWVLARLEIYPCELPSPHKGRAKPGEGKVCLHVHMLHAASLLTVDVLRTGASCATQGAESRREEREEPLRHSWLG